MNTNKVFSLTQSKLVKIAFVLLLSFLLNRLEARTVQIHEAGVQFDLPAGWQAFEEDESWQVRSPDGNSVAMSFTMIEAHEIDEAIVLAEEGITEAIGPIDTEDEPTVGELNGMQFIEINGTGAGGQISVSLTIFKVTEHRFLMIGYFADAENESMYSDGVVQLASSLKPITQELPKGFARSAKQPAPASKNSFSGKFSPERALTMLFAAPDEEGQSTWQASHKIFKNDDITGQATAKTRIAGFHEYKLSNKTSEILVILDSDVTNKYGSTTPMLGAALFIFDGSTCTLKLSDPALKSFGAGHEPVSVEFKKVSKDKWGAIVSSSSLHQGLFSTMATVLVVADNKVVAATPMPMQIYGDNHGTTDDESEHYSFTGEITFMPTTEYDYYILRLKTSGTMSMPDWDKEGNPFIIQKVDYDERWLWDSELSVYEPEIGC